MLFRKAKLHQRCPSTQILLWRKTIPLWSWKCFKRFHFPLNTKCPQNTSLPMSPSLVQKSILCWGGASPLRGVHAKSWPNMHVLDWQPISPAVCHAQNREAPPITGHCTAASPAPIPIPCTNTGSHPESQTAGLSVCLRGALLSLLRVSWRRLQYICIGFGNDVDWWKFQDLHKVVSIWKIVVNRDMKRQKTEKDSRCWNAWGEVRVQPGVFYKFWFMRLVANIFIFFQCLKYLCIDRTSHVLTFMIRVFSFHIVFACFLISVFYKYMARCLFVLTSECLAARGVLFAEQ